MCANREIDTLYLENGVNRSHTGRHAESNICHHHIAVFVSTVDAPESEVVNIPHDPGHFTECDILIHVYTLAEDTDNQSDRLDCSAKQAQLIFVHMPDEEVDISPEAIEC